METQELEVMSPNESASQIEAVSRAEIDIQIRTARAYPRKELSVIKQRMLSAATLDEETAASCFYKIPRGGTMIEGPSVRLAEVTAANYGNLRVATRTLETVTNGDNPHVVVQVGKHVGVTQKTAWFMCHRIRSVKLQDGKQLSGTIEVDETYMGGKEKNKHASKRQKGTRGRSTKAKMPVIGLIERGGEIRARAVEDCSMRTVESQIVTHAKIGSKIHSDDFISYSKIGRYYDHSSVAHGTGEYVNGSVHTNSIESFWALFKRGYHGVYHFMTQKHLQRYVDEYTYRFNRRTLSMQRVVADVVTRAADGCPLPHKVLTGKV